MWDAFLANGKVPEKDLRPLVSESWKRSSSYGVNPGSIKAQIVLGEEDVYNIKTESEMIESAGPILKDLARIITDTKHVAFLCNNLGQIVEVIGDSDIQYRAALNHLSAGADWSEERAGTNAIGTALKLNSPVQIFSAEHFCEGWHTWTCSATPIHNPVTGDILGILDITGSWNYHQSHTLGLVVAQARAIEMSLHQKEMIRQQKLTDQYLAVSTTPNADGSLAIDIHGRVSHINQRAARQLGAEPGLIIGRNLAGFPSLQNAISEILSRGEPNRQYEATIMETKLSRELHIAGTQMVENGKPIGVLVTVRAASPPDKHRNPYLEPEGLPRETDPVDTFWNRAKVKSHNRAAGNNTRSEAGNSAARYSFASILGHDQSFLKSIEMAKRATLNDSTVLIQGESGTGKELFAQAIHVGSQRSAGPFVTINCGALPKDLIVSELFGYAEGAFTGASKGGNPGKFELACGGTIFLDEIGEMPLDQQVNLLRVLEERTVSRIGGRHTIPIDVKIIAATNKNLFDQVRNGNFREDLFYRLNVINISLPPLRERLEDISLLVSSFLEKARRELGRPDLQISDEAVRILESYHWPGNIRELHNVIERTIQLNCCDSGYITSDCLPPELSEPPNKKTAVHFRDSVYLHLTDLKQNLYEPEPRLGVVQSAERDFLLKTLSECNYNMTKAAAELKMARSTLYRKFKKLHCEPN
ncbi:limonene hydroxylase [Peptococcaceae bacterium CEB3]|nr:limonene hydroxylase [Peptococcaceae bacterium CEB3]